MLEGWRGELAPTFQEAYGIEVSSCVFDVAGDVTNFYVSIPYMCAGLDSVLSVQPLVVR